MKEYREYIKQKKNQEVENILSSKLAELSEAGYNVEFGSIGKRTTYALISSKSADDYEVVGYTFLRDISRYQECVGKLKALQQAIARLELEKSKDQ